MSDLPRQYSTRKFNFWHRLFYRLTPEWWSTLFVRDHFAAGYMAGHHAAGGRWTEESNTELDEEWRGYWGEK